MAIKHMAHIAIVAASLWLSGCAVTEEVQSKLFDTTKVNLTDSTYAAADMLAPQTKARITQNTPIRMSVITNVATPTETTPFGTQLANQLGARFVQLGYNVQSVPMPPTIMPAGPLVLSPNTMTAAPQATQGAVKPSVGKGGECVIGGTYTRMKDSILVSLRILQAPDQRIIAAYDYTVPLTRELNDLSRTAADRKKREARFINLPIIND